jgi:hypothetical protein
MTTLSSIRWGDAQGLELNVGATGIVNASSSQLVHATWHWPLTWTVAVILIPQFQATEAGAFTVTIQAVLGVGQAAQPFALTYAFAAPPYTPIFDQRFLPSQDLQLKATVTGVSTLGPGTVEGLQVGLFAAPMTEPHAMTRMLEELSGQPQGNPQRFMEGIGLHEAPPYYQPR